MCTICSLTIEFAVEHPQSLAVAVATRQAIDIGLLPEPDPTMQIDMARSRHDAVVQLTSMQQRLEQVLSTSRLMELPNFYVLMIESRTWGYFQPTLGGFDVKANPLAPRLEPDENGISDNVVVMSQAGAAEITTGRLPFTSAMMKGLAIVDAPGAAESIIRSAFISSYPVGTFSTLVCTEVA
ncbi:MULTISPECIES: hypothetical protein [unclassified Rhizobium]|uniref:hypothetical protein n=1 Tax=unclassified Rhizobium TaxID=2613769 RepID=UPI001ADAF576|nr:MULTISPECIES: hypothetical protein [unclassified Rhizobium]MBO9124090.1 hypothetical protein [Rhizobium sp. 16-488-2b]MBO9174622.1 hypothetical protein [Rhizobium sp. 16-488-2a]